MEEICILPPGMLDRERDAQLRGPSAELFGAGCYDIFGLSASIKQLAT